MSAYKIVSAVIPEREDDTLSSKFLVVAPEDRIVWVATTAPGRLPDLSPAERKRAVANAEVKSLIGKLIRQEMLEGNRMQFSDIKAEFKPDCHDCNPGDPDCCGKERAD